MPAAQAVWTTLAQPRLLGLRLALLAIAMSKAASATTLREPTHDPCIRGLPGGAVPEPTELRSKNGVLRVDLSIYNYREPTGSTRYCYLLADGTESPTLRLHPGDQLILRLKNKLAAIEDANGQASPHAHSHAPESSADMKSGTSDTCSSATMSAVSTNLHFHGLTVPPLCHQDDVLKTSIQPMDAPFEYRFQIPANEPPGLYWYHPHIHGFSSQQVIGGALAGIWNRYSN